MAYKRKNTSATVTTETKVQVSSVDTTTKKDTIVEVELPPSERTVTATPIDLTVIPNAIYAGPSGITEHVTVGGSITTVASFSGQTHSEPITVATAVGYEYGFAFSGFTSSTYTSTDALFQAAYSNPGTVLSGFSAAYKPTGSSTWTSVKALQFACSTAGSSFSEADSFYSILDGTQSVTYSGSAKAVPTTAVDYDIVVAPLPTNDPHFIVVDGKPVYSGYWEYSANTKSYAYTTLDTAPSYTGYSTTVGIITVTDTVTNEAVNVSVYQSMPEDAGTVHPAHVTASNVATSTPITLLPELPASKKAYHPAELVNWTAQPNCSWIHFNTTAYSSLSSTYSVGDPIGCGTIAKATMYSGGPTVSSAIATQEAANQKVQFFLVTDANTTGKARVAYPTVTIGRKTYTITVNQKA